MESGLQKKAFNVKLKEKRPVQEKKCDQDEKKRVKAEGSRER